MYIYTHAQQFELTFLDKMNVQIGLKHFNWPNFWLKGLALKAIKAEPVHSFADVRPNVLLQIRVLNANALEWTWHWCDDSEMWGHPNWDTPLPFVKRQLAKIEIGTTEMETRSNRGEPEFHFAHRHQTRHEEDLMGRCDRLLGERGWLRSVSLGIATRAHTRTHTTLQCCGSEPCLLCGYCSGVEIRLPVDFEGSAPRVQLLCCWKHQEPLEWNWFWGRKRRWGWGVGGGSRPAKSRSAPCDRTRPGSVVMTRVPGFDE